MLKAFLCHSSLDKHYVDIVAKRLGRTRIKYDAMCFEPGVDFRDSIRKAESESLTFVFFASQNSLNSYWVKFEIQEAEELLLQQRLHASLAVVVDDNTSVKELPRWMRRGLVERVRQPSRAAQIIDIHLNRLRGLEVEPLFIGRDELLAEFETKLIQAPAMATPQIIIVGGLTGVGRRTFLKRVLKDKLSLDTGPIFTLEATDGIDTLHAKLLDELGELDSASNLSAAIKLFQKYSMEERGNEIAKMLAGLAVGNCAPMIIDNGVLLDADIRYTATHN